MIVAAAGACAWGGVPPREAGAVALDHVGIKAQQEAWEKANGLVPGEGGSGPEMRGVCPNSASRSPNVAIPQFNVTPGIVTDSMTTNGDPLLNVRARLIIPHTWQGDVIAKLRHEVSGIEVTLIDRPGGTGTGVGFSADNFGNNTTGIPFVLDDSAATTYDLPQVAAPGTANVTGSWKPDDLSFTLAAFNGLTAATVWTLTVSDNAGGDVGTLVSWTLCSDNALGQGIPTGVGSANPASVASGQSTTISVTVSPAQGPPSTDIEVEADLTLIGGSATQQLFDNATNGDDIAGDNIFRFTTVVTASPGVQAVPFTVSDAEMRSSTGSLNVTIIAPGDGCVAAVPVAIGSSVISNNASATNDPGLPTCNGLLTFNLGLWYTVVGNGNVLNATTCSANTVLNTRLYVYTGTCAALTCVDAAAATSPACSPATAASARFCSTSGQTYYILVTNDTTGSGQFELSVLDEGACLANDRCSGAVPLSVPSTTVVTTTGSTSDIGPPTCTTTIVRGGVWYTVVGNGNTYVADTCDSTSGNFDTRLSVFCAGATGGCGNLAGLTCITGIDNATLAPPNGCGTGTQQSRVSWCTQTGATYYILVHGGTGTQGATGTTTLTLGDLGSCAGAVACLPSGGCCVAGVCNVQTEAGCLAAGGNYLGDNSNCGQGSGPAFNFTSTPSLAIPDNGCVAAGFVTDSLVVPDSFIVGDVNVRVEVPDHTFIGDLRIRVVHGATTIALLERQCGTNLGLDVTFDDEGATLVCAMPTVGTYRPTGTNTGPLSAFDGVDSAGTWTLEICDGAGADLGTLSSWTLSLVEQDASVCGPAFCDADWCQDGTVGVPDIFCFLSDWFANDPVARNYGGTNGVPAIFAFLSEWFAEGTGPCP